MLGLLLAAAAVLPPDGTYTYALEKGGAQILSSQVVIAHKPDGLELREHTDLQGGITAIRRFDSQLREVHYAVQTPSIAAEILLAPGKATMTVGGTPQDFTLPRDVPALVVDGLFSTAAILPSIVATNHTTAFTAFTTRNPQALGLTVDEAASPIRPDGVPSSDRSLTMTLAGAQQTIWFDPTTYVVDEFDPASGTRVRLVSHNAVISSFAPASTPTPLPSGYPLREVRFTSRDGSTIAGSISYPQGAGRGLPAFVLVGGSGTHDRNEAVGKFHPFFDIAQGLNAQGYAVLRYDKRFAGGSVSKTPGNALTRQSYIDDVIAAVKAIRADPRVDPRHIYLLGHSEGGELVIGAQLEGVDARALVMLAPLPVPYATILDDQVRRGMGTKAAVDQLLQANATFMASWKGVDPRKEIARVHVPMLVVRGSDDINVTADELVQLTNAATQAHRNLHVVVLKGDDHLYSNATADFDPRVIQTIAAWLTTLR
jgi:alpha-beta hydrolase superfamily lysophospholipase